MALVTRRYPPLIGGAERVLSYLGPALAAEGLDVTVLTSRLDDSPALETGPGTFRVERLATSPLRFVGTMLYVRNLARWFARNRVDLAYVSMLKHDAYAALGAGARHGFPVVLRPEGAGATGDLAWQRRGRGGRAIARRCHRAAALVAISPAVRAELEADGYDPTIIHDLPNGVPIPDRPWASPGGPLRAAYVGRLSAEKGCDLLVAAWPGVLAEVPAARLTLVGEGPERPRLEAMARELGIADAVALPGSSPDPSIALRQSTLFVLPSREEGMSIALLEALALAIPTVASAIPGNRALIDPGVHGRLAPPGDPAELARAIVAAHRDPTAREMAVAARSRVEADYSIAAVARRHVALFGAVLGRRAAVRLDDPGALR